MTRNRESIAAAAQPAGEKNPRLLQVVFAFAAIYLIWGSTYLMIRYVVASVPPLFAAGTRCVAAAIILGAHAFITGYRLRIRHLLPTLVLGVLFFLLGHGLLHWGEQYVSSGLAALFVATQGLWVALFSVMRRHDFAVLTPRVIAGLTIGLAGTCILVLANGTLRASSPLGLLAIVASPIAWSAAIVYSRGADLPANNSARCALPLAWGGAFLLLASFAHEHTAVLAHMQVSRVALFAWAYLVIFGTVIAFSAYTYLLRECPPYAVSSYTYVNPVVAVVIGHAIAHEPMSRMMLLAGMLVVLALMALTIPSRSIPLDRFRHSLQRSA